MSWTPETKAEAVRLYLEDGLSASQIVVRLRLSCSRSAVIGVLHRAGAARSEEAKAATPALNRATAAKVERVAKVSAPKPAPAPKPPAPTVTPPWSKANAVPDEAKKPPVHFRAHQPGPHSASLADLGKGCCKFPVGPDDGREQLFCGEAAQGKYCANHERVAFRKAAA